MKTSRFRKFWHWLWNSNSLLSWIVAILLAFLVVRFIFYPLLGLVLATPLPLVVIESSSMDRSPYQDFDSWWENQGDIFDNFGITKEQAEKWPFQSGFKKGDIALIKGKKFENLKVGDVLVFRRPDRKQAIIHRIVKIENSEDKGFIETKGDANDRQIVFDINISPERVEGIAVLRIPYIGWTKLVLVEAYRDLRTP